MRGIEKFKIDYHFHPNLPKSDKKAIKKCEGWWKNIKKVGLNCVVVTEHSFKDFRRAYLFMKMTCPKDCHIFPGVEYLTKDGVDVIIFSDNPKFYLSKKLKSYKMDVLETFNFIVENNLDGYIAHPFTLGTTSIVKIFGENMSKLFINKFGAVEIANTCLVDLNRLLIHFLTFKFIREDINKINHTTFLPHRDYPKTVKFLAAGSDAHFFEQLGTYVIIDCKEKDLFYNMTHNKHPRVIRRKILTLKPWLLLKESINSFEEYRIKVKRKT